MSQPALFKCPCQSRIDPLPDDGSLELGENTAHPEHRLACRGRGVDSLLMEVQVDAQGVQLRQRGQQVFQGTPQTINRPSCHEVKLAAIGVLQKVIQGRPLFPSLRTADGVILVGADDPPAALFGDPLELKRLDFGGLTVCRHPQVQRNSFSVFHPGL